MKEQSRQATGALKRAVHLTAATLAIAGLGAVSGCLTRPIAPIEPLTTSTVVEKLTQSGVNKIDLVLVVDNSASMADKQAILALAIPDLIVGLVNPACLDNTTNLPVSAATQPADPITQCPVNSTREFTPVLDIHIGLLSSSLGTFGANGCPETPPLGCTGTPGSISNDDHGHLVTRTGPCDTTNVATYQNNGFLAWDPGKHDSPIGETAIGDPTATPAVPGLTTSLRNLVIGDGQQGCGYESQNEAWYRFLIDPTPYQTISFNSSNGLVTPTSIDQALLTQRKEFLRSDSLLAIIVVTDETDTSIKQSTPFPIVAQTGHLWHARSECTTSALGPNDPCCQSCGVTPNPKLNCPPEAGCNSSSYYTDAEENQSLRAFGLISHKSRYGFEFFYPPSRYVNGLTSPKVADNNGKQVPNPIFTVLDPTSTSTTVRDPGLVFYAAIVGVPWQLIARQTAAGVPDLIAGLDASGNKVGGFKSSAELDAMDSTGKHSFWDDIAGDPEHYVNALSPYMVESTGPRTGTDPITGIAVSAASSPNGTNPINGHEWNIPTPAGDIEYACIFDLPTPKNCADPTVTSCDCKSLPAGANNPLCEANTLDNGNLTSQTRAKAYPGIKHLAIARGMGSQGIAASICAKQVTNSATADYGYRPAVKAIVDRLKQALQGQCLPRTLTPDANGQVSSCLVLEARTVSAANAQACNTCPSSTSTGPTARAPVPANQQAAIEAAKADPLFATQQWNCFCEIEQTAVGTPLTQCLTAPTPTNSDGWCYVDPATAPTSEVTQETAVVSKCPPTEQHEIRFVNAGKPQSGATLFITCAGS